MFYLILHLFFSLLTIVMTGVMLFAFRKPRRITFFSSLLSVLISFLIPVIFLVLTGAKPDLKLMLPFFGIGLLLGFLRGVTMKLDFVGDEVVGRHSWFFLLLWGLSLALNQWLNTMNSSILNAAGLAVLFTSTGTQVGFYGILAVRRLALLPEDLDTGKISNKSFQKMITFAFGGLILIFLVEALLFSIPAFSFLDLPGTSALESGAEIPSLVSEPGAETDILNSPADIEPYFNGEQVLVWTRPIGAAFSESAHILYAFNADGSGVTQVYDQSISALDSPAPQLSPDGTLWVVTSFRTGDREHYLLAVDGSQTYDLVYQGALVRIKDWSPDGSSIVVQSQPSGNWDVLIADREGEDWQVVANQAADELEPRWSPDGGTILYLSNQEGNREIYLFEILSSTAVNLTMNSSHDTQASWGLAGTRIIFTSDRDGYFGLYDMNLEGNDIHLIEQDPTCGFKYQLSPNGEYLIYSTDAYYDREMIGEGQDECDRRERTLYSLSGREKIRLEISPYVEPEWSPDSRKFVYHGYWDPVSNSTDLLVYHLDGSGSTNINPPINDKFMAVWSSDSSRIAQVETNPNSTEPGAYVITVTNADGTGLYELVKYPWELDYGFAYEGLSWP